MKLAGIVRRAIYDRTFITLKSYMAWYNGKPMCRLGYRNWFYTHFFTRNISRKLLDLMLGAAAGVMLAATSFSLIVPAIEKGGGGIRGATITLVGILCGGIFLDFIDKFFPDTNLLKMP